MSETFQRIRALAARGEVEVSRHGLRELVTRSIVLEDILASVDDAVIVEDYCEAWKGPSVLVLQHDGAGRPIHVLWGISRETMTPAVLITAYQPDLRRWTADFMRRV